MRALLTALEEGRLIELPESDKLKSLTLLASLIEAVPSIKPGLDIVGAVLTRENQSSTALSHGWACPHARSPVDGDLVCAVGWSPSGIDYGAPDGRPVHLILLYFVPDVHRNVYLKEVSSLVRNIQSNPKFQEAASLRDLATVRNGLLDMITAALEAPGPDVRAKMVRLEARAATVAAGEQKPLLVPLWIVTQPGQKPLVLAQDEALVRALEADPDMADNLRDGTAYTNAACTIYPRLTTPFPGGRKLFDALAVRTANGVGHASA